VLQAPATPGAERTGVSEAIVALSDEERKRLQELEQDLAQGSSNLTGPQTGSSVSARGFGGFVVGAIGVLILLLGIAGGASGAAVFGFIVMATGVFLAVRARRSNGE